MPGREGDFAIYLLNSLLYTAVVAGVSTFASVLLAFPISRSYVRWPNILLGLFVVGLFLPNAIPTQFELILRLHLYNTRWGYMLVLVGNLGIGPLLLTGYMRSIPRELDQSAAVDGCGYFRYLLRFIIPLCRPAIVTVLILQAITVWNEIILATIYLPNDRLAPVSAGLFAFYGQYTDEWTLIAAATFIIAAPVVVAYVFLQRYFIAGALRGSLKASTREGGAHGAEGEPHGVGGVLGVVAPRRPGCARRRVCLSSIGRTRLGIV